MTTAPAEAPNYPDLLGHLTSGHRLNIDVAQFAMGVRPRVVRAGRSFEVVLLVQNASDCELDIVVTLKIPEIDAKKQKGKFITKHERLVVGLHEAEMGYMVLPMTCLPDTAVSDTYKVGMQIEVRRMGNTKPTRVRLAEGGGKVQISELPTQTAKSLDELKSINYIASAGRTTLPGAKSVLLEAGFSVMPGKLGEITDFKPGWFSLWTMRDHLDDTLLVQRYGVAFEHTMMPRLTRFNCFVPLLQMTQARFTAAHYPLKTTEAVLITKILVMMLEMGIPRDSQKPLPGWIRGLLRTVVREPDTVEEAEKVVVNFLYDDLLRDACVYAQSMVSTVAGIDLGDYTALNDYADRVVTMLENEKHLDFEHVYMPLVLAGTIGYDRIVMPNEDITQLLRASLQTLTEREAERTPANDRIFRLADKLINRAVEKFGVR